MTDAVAATAVGLDAGVVIDPQDLTVLEGEGASGTCIVRLATAPGGPVTVGALTFRVHEAREEKICYRRRRRVSYTLEPRLLPAGLSYAQRHRAGGNGWGHSGRATVRRRRPRLHAEGGRQGR